MESVHHITGNRVRMTDNYLIYISLFWWKYRMILGLNYRVDWILEIPKWSTRWASYRTLVRRSRSTLSRISSAMKASNWLKLPESMLSGMTRTHDKCARWRKYLHTLSLLSSERNPGPWCWWVKCFIKQLLLGPLYIADELDCVGSFSHFIISNSK